LQRWGLRGNALKDYAVYNVLLTDFITNIKFEELSIADVDVAKAGIIDCLGVMISGSQTRTVKYLMEELRSWTGTGEAVVVGHDQQAPAVWSSLLNGTAANAEHFDDLSPAMLGHPSSILVPGLISMASMRTLSGRDWLEAYACGFEVGVRLSRAANPSLYSMGFHATSVLGVVMAASVAAHLLGLDSDKTLSALGTSASLASGVRANFGSMTMALHVGHASSQGMLAALLASKGFSSDPEAVTGNYGFLHCFTGGQYNCEELSNLGKPFELSHSRINFKFYPSGHPTICAIEAALHLRSTYKITPAMIKEIHCFTPPWIKKTLDKNRPLLTGKEGKVNLPYCIAVALYRGNVTESDFCDDMLKDSMIADLRNCCHVHIDENLPDNKEIPARVEITLSSGQVIKEQRDRPSGSAEHPPQWNRIIQKFRDQSSPVLGAKHAEKLLSQLIRLENIENVNSITELLCTKGGRHK
jgi:2-methylcitrate dehydratase PrpD